VSDKERILGIQIYKYGGGERLSTELLGTPDTELFWWKDANFEIP